ncbi:MAG: heme-binding protein [Rhodospirillales bacterium]
MTDQRAIRAERARRKPFFRQLAAVLAVLVAGVLAASPAGAQNLTIANVQQIIAAAAVEANARGLNATIAVVDRVGNVLGVFDMPNAPPLRQLTIDSQKSIARTNGLENVQQTFTALGFPTFPSTRLSAIAKAITGAYLSSGGNAFTTRTASQIVQEHFNPRELFAPSGPLFGVQFTQLPCSDLSVRQATTAAVTGEVSATVGPKRSPLGLSADPGGLPLYIGNTVVGGIGVEADNLYTIDPNVQDFDLPVDEIIALAGQFSFQPPVDIRANRIFVEGKSLRYTDATTASLLTNPTAASFAAADTNLGDLVAVTGYAAAATIAGQTFGTVASGFASSTLAPVPADPTTFDFVGGPVFILYDNAGAARFPPRNSFAPLPAAGGMTANEVTTIIGNALKIAFAGRAQIRRPLNSHIQVTVSVVDADGNVLGIARTSDGPIFGTDTSLQKARTAAFFSNNNAGTYLSAYDSTAQLGATGNATLGAVPANQNANGVSLPAFVGAVRGFLGSNALQDGTAFSDRAGGNLSRPFFPDGIDDAPNGPLSKPFAFWSPFNTGLQLDSVTDNLILHILFADGAGTVDSDASCTFYANSGSGANVSRLANGFQIFPGSVPIYRGGVVIGGIGVSGDGIDQDDMTSFLGLDDASIALGTGLGNAPRARRADNLHPQGSHLRYVNCPYKPFIDLRLRNACAGK